LLKKTLNFYLCLWINRQDADKKTKIDFFQVSALRLQTMALIYLDDTKVACFGQCPILESTRLG
jgi:hypothetical protein